MKHRIKKTHRVMTSLLTATLTDCTGYSPGITEGQREFFWVDSQRKSGNSNRADRWDLLLHDV